MRNYSYHDCINNCGRKTNNSSGKCIDCRKEVCKKCGKKFARKINYYKENCYLCQRYTKISATGIEDNYAI